MAKRGVRTGIEALLALTLGAACHLPVGAFVEAEAIEVLTTTAYEEDLDRSELKRAVRTALASDGGRVALPKHDERRTRRVDLGLGPFTARDWNDPSSPALRGLRSGDLLLAKNGKAQSLGTTLSLAEFSLYDHVALLELGDDGAFVYESWPRVRLSLFASDFAARFAGSANRAPLGSFVRRYETIEAVRLPASGDPAWIARLLVGAAESLGEGIEFDPHHDPADPRMSCTEYVVYLVETKAGLALDPDSVPISGDESVRRLLNSLGFQTNGYVVPEAFAAQPGARTVGLISRFRGVAEVAAMRLGYELLHAHFRDATGHAGIGSYVGFDRWRLSRYRRNVRAFLEWSVGYAASLGVAPTEWSAEHEARLRADLRRILPLFFRRRAD